MILIGVAILSSSGHSINTVELVSVLIRAHGNRIMNKIHMITGAVLWRRGSIISEALQVLTSLCIRVAYKCLK